MTRMFSVVSLWTSDSSSQGWFFSCQAFRVSLAVNGGATQQRKGRGVQTRPAKTKQELEPGFTFSLVVQEEALEQLVLDGNLLRGVIRQDVFMAHIIQTWEKTLNINKKSFTAARAGG